MREGLHLERLPRRRIEDQRRRKREEGEEQKKEPGEEGQEQLHRTTMQDRCPIPRGRKVGQNFARVVLIRSFY